MTFWLRTGPVDSRFVTDYRMGGRTQFRLVAAGRRYDAWELTRFRMPADGSGQEAAPARVASGTSTSRPVRTS